MTKEDNKVHNLSEQEAQNIVNNKKYWMKLNQSQGLSCGDEREGGLEGSGHVFGADVFFALYKSITDDREFNDEMINQVADSFENQGLGWAAHTDNHEDNDGCGCAFVKKWPTILQFAVENEDKITMSLQTLFSKNSNEFKKIFGTSNLDELRNSFFEKSKSFLQKHAISFSGKTVLDTVKSSGRRIDVLSGIHDGRLVVVNPGDGTLNTTEARKDGYPMFSVDLQPVGERATVLGGDSKEYQMAALIFAEATKGVLKLDLPTVVRQS